jgi:hypothetical protein
MRFIQTQQDINSLHSANLFPALMPQIQQHFNHLYKTFNGENDSLSLDHQNAIIILEPGDNLYDLSFVSLNREDQGLLGCTPEYVQTIDLTKDGSIAYMIGVAYNNEYLTTFYLIAGSHDEEIEQWLQRQASRTLADNKIILQALKKLFEQNDTELEPDDYRCNIWLMLVSIRSYNPESSSRFLPSYVRDFFDNNLFSQKSLLPTHVVRLVLRTNDLIDGPNEYMDGNNYCFRVDNILGKAELLWKDEAFNDTPFFQGGNLTSALRWVNELAAPCHVQYDDPFLNQKEVSEK